MSINQFIEHYFFIIFIIFWIANSLLISVMSGWWQLARDYKIVFPFQGRKWHCQSITLRASVRYGSMMTVGGNSLGIYLCCFFPFRLGHPPLFIPWSEISWKRERKMWQKVVKLRIAKHPTIPIWITERLFNKIVALK